MADLREDAARAVVQEAQQAAEPGLTLAEMVTELLRLDGLPRDRKARAWAAYLDSCRRSRLRSKAYLGRALPDVRR